MIEYKNKHMKKASVFILFLFCALISFAQYADKEEKGFKKENIFIGSGINLGFSNGFIVGLNPEIGYSFNNVFDLGVATNFSFITQRSLLANESYTYTAIGGGPFARAWIAGVFFVAGQFEYNQITEKYKINGTTQDKNNYSSPSVLVGAGYGRKFVGQSQFYTSLMVDVLRDPKSPYTDRYNRLLPVFRTAFIFYLRPKKQRD